MNGKNTWLWMLAAAGLFAFIFFLQRHTHRLPPGPSPILPTLKTAAVASVQVRLAGAGQAEIRTDRTKGGWQLTELAYPAQAASIENLLAALASLVEGTYITDAEIRSHPNAEAEYGLAPPQVSLVLQQGERIQVLLGAKTAPGDQVFLQVAGKEGVFVVDAELLKLIPRSADDWRETRLVNLERLAFDRVAVTNNAKAFVLQRDGTNQLWRLGPARADNPRLEAALQQLQNLRIQQFLPAEPKADLEALGLAPPELELALGQGTNTLVHLQFGKSPTNDAGLVYGRRLGQNAIFTVPKEPLAPWRGQLNEFRDPRLLTLTEPVAAIEVRGQDSFSLLRQTNGTWQIEPGHLPADVGLVEEFLAALSGLQIVHQFTKDIVNPPDWPAYGLAAPVRREYLLKAACPGGAEPVTNAVLADLYFGTNQEDRVFARRSDEISVYAVRFEDFQRLPAASWQLRERRLWHFSENDVVGLTIRQRGKRRQLQHNGPYKWALAPGSQGLIEDLALEESLRGLVQAQAAVWVACGEVDRARYGFADDGHQIILELKDSQQATIDFGGQAPSGLPYAAVTLDGRRWVLEFPVALYQKYVLPYLSVP